MLSVLEEPNGLMFSPVRYLGEESSRNVFYTGAASNQQAIPVADCFLEEPGVESFAIPGTGYVYPGTTNNILDAYLKSKGVAESDIFVTLTAIVAGTAGALYYPQAGIVNPAEIAPIASIYLAVWVAIAGRHPHSGGRITLDGVILDHLCAARAARAGIGNVPQGREMFPLLTVTENLQTGFACLPKSEHRIPFRIHDLFPVLAQMKDRRGRDLSGGQQQQLAIARALIAKPRMLLLDEPTEGIQPNIITQIGEVITLLRDEGKIAIVLVEQYFDFAHRLADEVVALNRVEVRLQEPAATVERARLLREVSI